MLELRVGSDSPAIHVAPVTAGAKLQVLGLAPIKARLGSKWDRLSNLVHRLFETAIGRVQGPSDILVRVDELNYVLTLHALSIAEANVVCIGIAKEICEHLFGNRIDEVSVRSTVGEVPLSATLRGAGIAKALEHSGRETVVTKSAFSGTSEPVVSVFEDAMASTQDAMAQIEKAHTQLAWHRVKAGLFPVWDIHKRTASTLFFAPFMKNPAGGTLAGRAALNGIGDAETAEIEIALLQATEAYATRLRKADKMGAVGVGVCYDTLNAFHRRIRYITALQKVRLAPSTPLVIKIESVPNGAPLHRIADLVAMLGGPNVKITVGFDSAWNFSRIDQRLGAAGICTDLPVGIDNDAFVNFVSRLTRQAAWQKAFSVLNDIGTMRKAVAAARAGVRFASGMAFGDTHFTGLEEVPDLPLACQA